MRRKKKKSWIRITIFILIFLIGTLLLTIVQVNKTQQVQTKAASAAFKFVAWGDTKSGTSTLSSLTTNAQTFSPVFTIYSGDVEDSGFTQSGFDSWKTAIGALYSKTFVTRGNHDSGDSAGWQGYFNFGTTATTVGATNYTALTPNQTYSFEYANSIIIGIDDPGGEFTPDSSTTTWVDQQLTAAEGKGLVHAFIFAHGPIYYTDDHQNTPPAAFITMLNKHPIVSAYFNGHEHVLAYTHLDSTRVSSITHAFEQVGSGSTGAGTYNCASGRSDWCQAADGFAVISVNDANFTIDFYTSGTTSVYSKTITKPGSTTPSTGSVTTPQGVTPTFVCAGGSNCAPSATPTQATTTVAPTQTVTTTAATPTDTQAKPSPSPASTTSPTNASSTTSPTSGVQVTPTTAQPTKTQGGGGNINPSNLITKFIQLILDIIKLLLNLLRGGHR